jgi:hypothetical protein
MAYSLGSPSRVGIKAIKIDDGLIDRGLTDQTIGLCVGAGKTVSLKTIGMGMQRVSIKVDDQKSEAEKESDFSQCLLHRATIDKASLICQIFPSKVEPSKSTINAMAQ